MSNVVNRIHQMIPQVQSVVDEVFRMKCRPKGKRTFDVIFVVWGTMEECPMKKQGPKTIGEWDTKKGGDSSVYERWCVIVHLSDA